jgi:hypothetical protein
MTLGRTPTGAIKIKTDGGLRAVGCACCGGGCSPTNYFDNLGAYQSANQDNSYQITKEQYDSFHLGGLINWSASINISFGPFGCSFSHSGSISIQPNSCLISDDAVSPTPTCINNPNYYGLSLPYQEEYSSSGFSIVVFKHENNYYLHTSGYIACPVGNGSSICSQVFRFIGKVYSAGGGGYASLLGVSIGHDPDTTWGFSFTPNVVQPDDI